MTNVAKLQTTADTDSSIAAGSETSVMPTGVILTFAGTSTPNGWLICDGRAVSRTIYSGLFATISTTYGSGDGSTTFNLPDLRGRFQRFTDQMPGGSAAGRNGTTLAGTQTDTTKLANAAGNTATFTGNNASTSSVTGITGSTGASTASLGVNLAHSHTASTNNTSLAQIGGGNQELMINGDGVTITSNTNSAVTVSNSGSLDHSHSVSLGTWTQSGSGTAAAQAGSGTIAFSTTNVETRPISISFYAIIKT